MPWPLDGAASDNRSTMVPHRHAIKMPIFKCVCPVWMNTKWPHGIQRTFLIVAKNGSRVTSVSIACGGGGRLWTFPAIKLNWINTIVINMIAAKFQVYWYGQVCVVICTWTSWDKPLTLRAFIAVLKQTMYNIACNRNIIECVCCIGWFCFECCVLGFDGQL